MGVGAAFIMPSTLSILVNIFPPEERTKASPSGRASPAQPEQSVPSQRMATRSLLVWIRVPHQSRSC